MQHNSNIFLNTYNLWDMVPAAHISLNHTNDKYSMSSQYPQPTTHQPRTDSYPVFSSLRWMDSRRKGLRVSFAFFQRNYLPDGRVNETVATVEELSDLWKPGAMDGIPPFLMNCNCFFKCCSLFLLFDIYCLLAQYLLFFRKFIFLFPLFDDFE